MSEKIIGSGQFGKVYEGFEVETNSRGMLQIVWTNPEYSIFERLFEIKLQ